MRWGLLAGLTVLANGFASASCDSPQHEATQRYYFPPDASGPDDTTPGSPGQPGSPGEGGGQGPDGSATDGGPIESDASVSVALNGFWRAGFTAAPWSGTATSGPSGGQVLTAGTAPPTAGVALGGLPTADFNGTNAWLTGAPVSTFHSVTTFSGWALINVDSINTDDPLWSANDAVLCTSGTGQFGVYLRSNTGGASVGVAASSTVDRTVLTTLTMNSWQLVQWRSDGTTMSIRVNGGTWASTGTGTVGSLATALELGRNPGQTQFFDGRIADVGLTTTKLSDAEFDAVRAYASARYGLTL